MARKWSNLNLPGALHFVTGNFLDRTPVFTEPACCRSFLNELRSINQKWPSKLIAYVLMPDHFHLISNPRDGRIREFVGELKSLSAKSIVQSSKRFRFRVDQDGHQVWQESFKALPLWSGWMIWQKINYIHANPVKAGLVKSAKDYRWSSFTSFHSQGDQPLAVDHDWWWSDDAEKLSQAVVWLFQRALSSPNQRLQCPRSNRRSRGVTSMKPIALPSVMLLLALASQAQQSAATYQLKPTPKTVAWGYYDASTPPVLRIKSGDTVEIQTLITSTPARLEGAGVKPADVEQSLREIVKEVTNKGPGGHILTGPIFIESAEPGDVLEVRIKTIKLAIPYAYNAFSPGRGFLPEDFPYARMRIIPLDEKRMVAHFADGIEIPLRPFFGSMGVAPPEVSGRISSAPPWIHAGNLDNKELVAGTTLFIPIHAKGALFLAGDGHAGQGNGEVDITAMETSLIGTFQLVVRKDMKLRWPRAETPTHYITMGLHEDLNEATKMALREMIDFLVTEKHLTRDDAYQLSSVAADLDITQLVDGNKGVHAMIPKAIFVSPMTAKDDFVTLERTVCFGSCPSYKVTITQDGTVTYEGRDFVKTKGTASAQIKPEDFNKLAGEFEKIRYFSLDDRYEPGSPGCPTAATDSPSARTSIQMSGRTKGVSHYYGCRDSEVLRALTALERKIDEVAGTEKWIR